MVGVHSALAAVALLIVSHSTAQAQAISDWAGAALGTGRGDAGTTHPVTTQDLLQLRDLGGLSLSPDGHLLAFSVREANLEANAFVMRWFVAPSDGSSAPMPLDGDGGQPIPAYSKGNPQAYVPPERPEWSPDGNKLAYRRMIDQRVELWVADLKTNQSTRVADGTSWVSKFGWSRTGQLIYRTSWNYERYAEALRVEAHRGWLFDERFRLAAGQVRPLLPDCRSGDENPACDVQVYAYELSGTSRMATSDEAAQIAAPQPIRRSDGALVAIRAVDPALSAAARPLLHVVVEGASAICRSKACRGDVRAAGWSSEGAVWFLKAEGASGREDGAPGDLSAIYEWTLATGRVRSVFRGPDLLEDCHVVERRLLCMRERVDRPRHIVALHLDSGRVTVVADPNPQFRNRLKPRVRKIDLVDFDGNPGFAYVVYPIGYKITEKYPLVVVQYNATGFLRGGTGNEYPIYPLSAKGFVVLAVDKTEDWSAMSRLGPAAYDHYVLTDDLRGRRAHWGAIQNAIDHLIAEGLVDGRRMALTGLSAGAEITHYALQHSSRFTAAITSSGVQDQSFFALVHGVSRQRFMEMYGSSTLLPPKNNPLAQMAWSSMPERLKTPLLINVADRELMIGFEGIQALRQAGRPIEVRVFPDEGHVKYHPQTYAGIYANNIAWLEFWLLGIENADPDWRSTYDRWEFLQARLASEHPMPPAPSDGGLRPPVEATSRPSGS